MKKFSFLLLLACVYISGYSQEVPDNIIVPPTSTGACQACNTPYLVMNIPASGLIVFNPNNTMTQSQAITLTLNPFRMITSIKAELIYFEFVPESEECLACNKNSATFGNFNTATIA